MLVGRLELKTTWDITRRWDDNIKILMKEAGPEVVGWIHMHKDRP
jgi:hypothetical protein